jgi:hypothetical protein
MSQMTPQEIRERERRWRNALHREKKQPPQHENDPEKQREWNRSQKRGQTEFPWQFRHGNLKGNR